MEFDVWQGILVGAVGGACAGIAVKVVGGLVDLYRDCTDKKAVYDWFTNEEGGPTPPKFRTTRAIASWNDLTEDRARYICSRHPKIYLSTGAQPELWSIQDREPTPSARSL